MGIFDIFRSTPEQQVPTQQVQQPVAVPPAQQQTPPNQGNIPAAPTVVADPNNPTAPVLDPTAPVAPVQKDESPLAEFATLWQNEPTKEGEQPVAPPELTAESLQKVMAKADFSKAITQENLAAITAGGEGAAKALMETLTAVAQQSMVQSTLINSKLTEQAVQRERDKFSASLPELLRSQAAADHLKSTNPLFTDPAIKPVIEATQAQLLQKFPNATHAEITTMTEKFVIAMGESFAPKAVVNDNSDTGTDWDKFMNPGG